MRTYFVTGMICLACSSFSIKVSPKGYIPASAVVKRVAKPNVFELTVHRLSGNRVVVSWHSEGEAAQARFEVMRKHGNGIYSSLGFVEPKLREDNSADYSFVDVNAFEDSSFYCVKKTDPDGVIFFSLSRGIEGVGKER